MQNNDQKQIAGAILIVGVLIAGAILLKDSKTPVSNTAQVGNVPVLNDKVAPVSSDDHIFGNPKAKTIIVEYSDLECPFCKVFHATMHKVVADSNDEVAWVYRHYPIAQLHAKAFKEAEATECAYDQGGNTAFWQYIDRLFEITPSNDGLDFAELPKIAKEVGLNVDQFNTCLESGKYKALIEKSLADGGVAGVNGTPAAFIFQKGKVVDSIPGAQPYEAIMQRLEALK